MKRRLMYLVGLLNILLMGQGLFSLVGQAAELADDDYEFAVRLFAEKDYQLALENFQAFLKKNPNHSKAADALFKITFCYGQLQEYAQAARSSLEFAEKYPTHELTDAAQFNIGYYFFLAKDYEAATKSFARYLDQSQNAELIPQAFYWQGESLFELNRIPEAIAAYQTIIDQHPKATFSTGELILPYAIYSVAFCKFHQYDYEGALQGFELLRTKIPEDSTLQVEACWYIAECYFRLEQWEKALDAYQAILDRFPNSDYAPDAMLGKALSELRLKKGEAIGTFEEVLRKYPGSSAAEQAQIRLGDALVEEGKWLEARQRYQSFLQDERSPRYPEALWGTAESFFREGNYAESVPLYQKILSLDSPHPFAEEAMIRLAFCYLQGKQYDEAIRLYTLFLETAKDHQDVARIHLNRGICYKQKGDMAQAIADYEASIKAGLSEEDKDLAAKVYLEMGDYYLSQGQYAQALSAYQWTAGLQPPSELSGSGLFGAALVAERQERYQEAALLYEQFVQQYSDHPKVKQGLEGAADMYDKLGRKDYARTFRDRVLELDPQSFATRLNGAISAFHEKDYHRVIELLEPVQDQAAHDPNGAVFWQILGATYFHLKQWGQADAAYGKLTVDFPASQEAEEALFWQGQAQYQNQKKEEAINSLESFVQAHENHSLALEARLLLTQIYREVEKPDRAEEMLKQLAENPNPEIAAEALYEMAWNFYDEGNKKEALALWQRLVQTFPGHEKSGYAQLQIGREFYERKDYTAATQSYQSFLERFPDHKMRGDAYYRLAWCQRAQGQEEAAQNSFAASEKELLQYIAAHPQEDDLGDLYFSLGWTRYDRGDFIGAAEAFQQAAQKPGKDREEALCRRGQSLLLARRDQEAIQQLNEFLAAYPHSPWAPEALHYRGRAYLLQKEWEAAEADFRRVINEFPQHEIVLQVRLGLGHTLQNQADQLQGPEKSARYNAALQEYNQVLEQASQLDIPLEAASEAQYRRAECLYHQDKFTEARDGFLRAAFNAVKYPHYDRWAGRSRYMAGNCFLHLQDVEGARKHFEKAREHFQKMLETVPLDAELKSEALYFQGLVMQALGDKETARSLWQRVVDEKIQTDWTQQAQEALGAGE